MNGMNSSTPALARWASKVIISSLGLLCAAALPAHADDTAGVARVSLLNGTVTMQRADSGDTIAAVINAPVMAGDYLSTTTDSSRAEVQLDNANLVRAGSDAQLRFSQLDPTQSTVQVAAGTVELRVLAMTDVHPQVQTPSVAIQPVEAGRYRVTVTGNGATLFTVRSGRADLVTPQGQQTIVAGHSVLVSGPSTDPQIGAAPLVAYDAFDSWNDDRDEFYARVASGPYASSGIVGLSDLNAFGRWVSEPNYGQVWVAYNYPAGWAPYHYGRWAWEPYYGWTWVGYEPWGWAPYHYGNWLWAPRYGWAWYPGSVIVRPVYRPAVVAFFGFGGGNYGSGFSFNVAFGNVGWVPLAPYEPYHPWWGPGWANRTTIINNYNVTNITNVNITQVYRNAAVPGGVAVVRGDNFTNGSVYHYVPVHEGDLKNVALVKSTLPIVPTKQTLSFSKAQPNQFAHVTPVSTRFASLPAPAKRPPSFGQQQTAVQTVAQHVYGTNGAGNGASGSTSTHAAASGSTSSAWGRFDNTGSKATGGSAPTYQANAQTSEQWHAYDWSASGKNAPVGGKGTTSNGAGNGSSDSGPAKTKSKTTTHHGSHPSGGSANASPAPH
jgi:hypothetical protein